MIGIGIAGIGFMGTTHYQAAQKLTGGEVVAICSRDARKLAGDWRNIQGNFGGAAGEQDLRGIGRHERFEALLADDRVDLVDICLPTPMHAESAIAALAAGKHVLVEKPIALTLADADRMLAAAAASGKQLLVAHVLRFFPEFVLLRQAIADQRYGALLALHCHRHISRPAWWTPDDVARSGGPALDLHIHDVDFLRLLFGTPASVQSSGLIGKYDVVEYIRTAYTYDDLPGVAVSSESGWLGPKSLPFEHGYTAWFEAGCLRYSSAWAEKPRLYGPEGDPEPVEPPAIDGFVAELQEAVDAISEKRSSPSLAAESGRASLEVCLCEVASVHRGERVTVGA